MRRSLDTPQGELSFQRCADCRAWRHYPRPSCPQCLSRRFASERASGRGRIYTWATCTIPATRWASPNDVTLVKFRRAAE